MTGYGKDNTQNVYKAKVALEALKEQSTLAELAKKYELSQALSMAGAPGVENI